MIKEINIGYDMPNLINLFNETIQVLGISSDVYIMPMAVKLDDNAYALDQGGKYMIFISPKILRKDKVTDFNIRLAIHELTHVKQMEDGDLQYRDNHRVVIWNGEEYRKDSDYDSRPFEIEARSNERKYFKKVKESYNSKYKNKTKLRCQ